MATLGPDSFVIQPVSNPLSPGSGMTESFNSSAQTGGGTSGVSVDSSGAMLGIQKNMEAMDSLVAFSGKILEPKLEEMQKSLMWKGVQRASQGESMEDIRSGETFLSRLFNTNYMGKGAAVYRSSAAMADLARETSDDEKIKAMDPDEYRTWLISRVNEQKIGDAETDSMIEAQAIQIAPLMFKQQGVAFEEKRRSDLERERFNATRSQADLIKALGAQMAQGKISPEVALNQQAMLEQQILARAADETDEAYSRRLVLSGEAAANSGNMSILSALQKSGAIDMMPPAVQVNFRSTSERGFQIAVQDVHKANPEMASNFQVAFQQASTVDEKMGVLDAYDEWIRLNSGLTPGSLDHLTAVDREKAMTSGRIEYIARENEEAKRLNSFEHERNLQAIEDRVAALSNSGRREEALEASQQGWIYALQNGLKPEALGPMTRSFKAQREGAESYQEKQMEIQRRIAEQKGKEGQKAREEALAIQTGTVNLVSGRGMDSVAGESDAIKSMVLSQALAQADDIQSRAMILADAYAGSVHNGSAGYSYQDKAQQNKSRTPFQMGYYDEAAFTAEISVYQAMKALPNGPMAAEAVYGSDLVKKHERYLSAVNNPDQKATRDVLYDQIYLSDDPTRSLQEGMGRARGRNDAYTAIGQKMAEEDSRSILGGFFAGGFSPTQDDAKAAMAVYYANAMEHVESIYGATTPESVKQQHARREASKHFTLVNGRMFIPHHFTQGEGKSFQDLLLEQNSSLPSIQLPDNQQKLDDAIEGLIQSRIHGEEANDRSWWPHKNLYQRFYDDGGRDREYRLINSPNGVRLVAMISLEGMDGAQPITIGIDEIAEAFDSRLRSVEEPQKPYVLTRDR